MEHMVNTAVKGTPATSKSRTEQLKAFKRARTPFPTHTSGTSSEGTTTPTSYDLCTERETSTGDETGDPTFHEKTDNAGDMAIIEQKFARPTTSKQVDRVRASDVSSFTREVPETSDTSCPDETLSQVRHQAIAEKTFSSSKGKQTQKRRRVKERGVPMREEFFSKIGWTRYFISGIADPLHNSHTVRKNFSIRSKGPEEILRHPRTENVCAKTNVGAMNF